MLVRVRTKDGLFRIECKEQDDTRVLVEKILANLPAADLDSLQLSNEPRNGEQLASDLYGKSLASLGITHGHLLYASYSPRTDDHSAQDTSSAADSAPETKSARPWENVQEDQVDIYWEKQPGTIARSRDPQFCRHGDQGMCDYCMPLEPYDAGYHASHNIKHLSFHAFLRKQNIAMNASSSSTFVPPLEEAEYRVKVPCPAGQHPAWPAGICTKCQPSAITLQRQPYRMVDHLEFASPSLIERMLEIWRKTNAQRFGFLLGRYEPYTEVPMGTKAVVEAIHEPPQQGEIDGLALGIPWQDQSRIEHLAKQCGLQIIGMVYTDLESADPTHSDPSKAGLVACKRHLHSFFLSGAEAIFAAQLQGANRAKCRFSQSGEFNSRFVTCILTGNPEGVVDIAAYQVSEQAMGMVEADMIEASVEPTTIRVKPSEDSRYVPEVFFRYKNKYNIDVKESAKPTFPVEYLIVNTTHGFPTASNPRFLSESFPIENRPGLHDQDLSLICRELAQYQPDFSSSSDPSLSLESRQSLVRYLSDWHMLAFLGQTGILNDDEMKALCTVAVTHDTGNALDNLLHTNGWHTLLAISSEYQPSNQAEHAAETEFNAPDESSQGDPAPGSEGGITCPHCTFVNEPSASDCDICGLPLH
ncbi:nuclear protein localization protein 4 [Malassezia psittaci]|uniref:Nuclear protein localization protein 4 n=1 Tax=Malassezia psittaci TaxID=1821823 RepID=A0AAF0F835_9BASI|nr:nuclear protein localization protein 4 [Malassezia psittaci]